MERQRQSTELEIGGVFDPTVGEEIVAGRIAVGRARHIGYLPLDLPTVEHRSRLVVEGGHGLAHAAGSIVGLIADGVAEIGFQGNPFVTECGTQATEKVGGSGAERHAVFVIDDAIVVLVDETYIATPVIVAVRVFQPRSQRFLSRGVHAIGLVTVELVRRPAYFGNDLCIVFVIGLEIDDVLGLRIAKRLDSALGGSDITGDHPIEIFGMNGIETERELISLRRNLGRVVVIYRRAVNRRNIAVEQQVVGVGIEIVELQVDQMLEQG